jgi:hypothetical protein
LVASCSGEPELLYRELVLPDPPAYPAWEIPETEEQASHVLFLLAMTQSDWMAYYRGMELNMGSLGPFYINDPN